MSRITGMATVWGVSVDERGQIRVSMSESSKNDKGEWEGDNFYNNVKVTQNAAAFFQSLQIPQDQQSRKPLIKFEAWLNGYNKRREDGTFGQGWITITSASLYQSQNQNANAGAPVAPTYNPNMQTAPMQAAPSFVNGMNQMAPMQAAPSQVPPMQAAPVQTAPSFVNNMNQMAPMQAAPSQMAPMQTDPAQAAPMQAAPQAAPMGGFGNLQTAPMQAAPTQAAPMQNVAPMQAAPVQTATADPATAFAPGFETPTAAPADVNPFPMFSVQ